MDNAELLDNLHSDFKRLNIPYDAHAQIQNIITAYKNQLKELNAKKEEADKKKK